MTLITGGNGQLGAALAALIPDAMLPGSDALDLTRPDQVAAEIARLHPTAIINCGAYTAVDAAEDDEPTAAIVNGTSVGVLAAAAIRLDVPFITFSSDYVFDGAASTPYVESSPPNPVNAYGRSKLLGERMAMRVNPKALIVRSSWLFSATHPNFVTTIVDLAAVHPVDVVNDQIGCPTFAPDLAAATLRAMDLGASGLLHLTNEGVTTWFDLARASCIVAGVDPERVRPITSAQYRARARRPRYSVLGSERRRLLGVDDLRPWRQALPHALGVSQPD